MKHHAITGVPSSGVRERVPPAYRKYLTRYGLTEGARYTLLMFPQDVVLSRSVRKALKSVPAGERIIALARDFTKEAEDALREAGVNASLAEFGWTDASYIHIREDF